MIFLSIVVLVQAVILIIDGYRLRSLEHRVRGLMRKAYYNE